MGRQQKSSTGRKIGLSLGLIVISAVYAVWQQTRSSASSTALSPATVPASIPATQPSPEPPTTTATPVPAPAPQKPIGRYADGSYTGTPADAYYGTVQVRAVVRSGKITDVQFLQHPDSRANSVRINSEAMPLLAQEAIVAQSAEVDGVSGATFTSGAFRESLASALALAKN